MLQMGGQMIETLKKRAEDKVSNFSLDIAGELEHWKEVCPLTEIPQDRRSSDELVQIVRRIKESDFLDSLSA